MHYYAALQSGLGNNIRAQEEARTAVSMEPNNYAYQKPAGSAAKPGPQLHKLPAALRPAQRQPGVFLSVVLDVFIGVQYFELVLLRRQRRILYLLDLHVGAGHARPAAFPQMGGYLQAAGRTCAAPTKQYRKSAVTV